jgi:hypothetical protein
MEKSYSVVICVYQAVMISASHAYNSDGTLDTTFGTSGKVIQSISSSYDKGYSLAIQPDGKILLGGYCSNGSNIDFCIARFET